MTAKQVIRLVQITDSHLFADPSMSLLGMNTMHSLNSVIGNINQQCTALDLLLATGDIAQDGSIAAYENFIASVSTLDLPFAWLPGNHDDGAVMDSIAANTSASGDIYRADIHADGASKGRENLAQPIRQKTLVMGNWQIILIDSTVAGHTWGHICPKELNYLHTSLEQAKTNPRIEHCLVCLHHNPLPENSQWLEKLGLRDNKSFFDVMAASNMVRMVIHGHIHQDLELTSQGIRCMASPSTCVQFKPGADEFELDQVNPGYRLLNLHSDGAIETELVRLQGTDFKVDTKLKSY
ncbi:MAG: hypothetical protein COC19_01650 [SAR86 cluster bacterium]|uniref:Calcineurin-like phosphoesterase domain-containing protein n=1 Tax=SAR86 cluster bacterium TaxID=2030880 RepID=A0A2A4MTM0_9GAMM|nr:MAG: hypothetical protein COC19_01650 [SAR86 cluster bacterium]